MTGEACRGLGELGGMPHIVLTQDVGVIRSWREEQRQPGHLQRAFPSHGAVLRSNLPMLEFFIPISYILINLVYVVIFYPGDARVATSFPWWCTRRQCGGGGPRQSLMALRKICAASAG